MIDTSAQFETNPSLNIPDNLDEIEEFEMEPSGEILSAGQTAGSQVSRSELSPITRSPDFPIQKLVGPDGHPSLTPLDHRTRRTNTVTLGPRQGPNGPDLVAEANHAPRCAHVRASGVRCGSPALRGGEFCYFHNHTHNAPRLIYPSLSRLEDAHGIQIALMEVLAGIMDGRIEHKTGALLLYGLQTAVSNLKHMPEIDPADVTTEQPEAQDRLSRVDAEAVVAAEKAAVAEAVRTTYDHLDAHYHIPRRRTGDAARDANYAELMASYYRHDPDSSPPPRHSPVPEAANSLVNST